MRSERLSTPSQWGADPSPLLSAQLEVTVGAHDGRIEVKLEGELDIATSSKAREILSGLEADDTVVVLDMSALTFIDSTGLSVLVGALKRRRSGGGDLVLKEPTASARRVLEVTGLTQVFTIA